MRSRERILSACDTTYPRLIPENRPFEEKPPSAQDLKGLSIMAQNLTQPAPLPSINITREIGCFAIRHEEKNCFEKRTRGEWTYMIPVCPMDKEHRSDWLISGGDKPHKRSDKRVST